MGEKNCDLPLKNGTMGAKRPDSLPLNAPAAKLWQKPPISPSLRRVTPPPHQPQKVTSHLQITSTPPLLPTPGSSGHQRSFTSVNFTLRTPTSEPQPPIEITSANSSLTYSTSSFDSHKGLESRLQITVSPTGGSVASYRRHLRRQRPHSCHLETTAEPVGGAVARSMPDLSLGSTPTLLRQQAKIDRLKGELSTERQKLATMHEEVARLEKQDCSAATSRANEDLVNAELEKQLLKEILHLRGQCERLTIEVDQRVEQQQRDEEFYRNIYVGQRHPPNFGRPIGAARDDAEAGWSCPKCTFHNHPSMGKCEQCDMPCILHGTLASQLEALSKPLNLPKIT